VKRLLLLFLLLIATPALGAVAYDTFSESACSGCTGDSWSHTTTGSNTLILCGAGNEGAATVSAFTHNSLSLTLVDSDAISSYNGFMYQRVAPTTGAQTVAITYSEATNSTLGCLTFTGTHQVSPLGTAATNTDSAIGFVDATITIPANGMGASLAIYGNDPGVGCSDATTTQTEKFELCDGPSLLGLGSTTASTGSVAMDWTFPAVDYSVIVAAPINEAAAAAVRRRKAIGIE
jgi:hypothetical protein